MTKLIVFDLGETLINYKGLQLDWSSHYEKSLAHVFNRLSINYNESMILEVSAILLKYNTRINPRVEEVTAAQIFNEVINAIKIDPVNYNQFVKEFFGYFQRDSEPEETAHELLRFLKSNNINTSILTDVPYGMPKEFVLTDLHKLLDYIDLVVTSEEVGYRKPSTIGLEFILKHFQADIRNTIYIGNERKDIEMANKFGVSSVLIKPGGDAPDWGQTKTIRKLIEIKSLLN